MSSNTIFLNNPEDQVVLFGKTFTAEELKDALIDQAFFRMKLHELMGGDSA